MFNWIWALIVGIGMAVTGVNYSNDLNEANERITSYAVQSAETSYGAVAYVEEGEGIPVLMFHGITGGYDQAILNGRSMLGKGYRIIAPSRFGYPGSSLPADSTPKHQAAAYAQFLKAIGVEKVVVVALSAGGGPALRFAMDYPELTRALILVSSAAPTEPGIKTMAPPPNFVYNDFPMWMAVKMAKPMMLSMFGVSRQAFDNAPQEVRDDFNFFIETTLPMGPRRLGVLNDNKLTNPDVMTNYDEYVLESLRMPVLIVNAKDDPMARFETAVQMHARIPGAEIKVFDDGGHALFNHSLEVRAAINDFINRH